MWDGLRLLLSWMLLLCVTGILFGVLLQAAVHEALGGMALPLFLLLTIVSTMLIGYLLSFMQRIKVKGGDPPERQKDSLT